MEIDKNNGSKKINKKILDELDRISDRLEEIESRLSYIEEQTDLRAPEEKPIPEEVRVEERVEEIAGEEKLKSIGEPMIEEEIREEKQKEIIGKSTEEKIGVKWLSWIGIISLFFAMIFLVKYSFEHGSIGPMGKVIIGIMTGLVLLVIGDVLDKRIKYTYFSRVVTGGGFAILFLTIYAMHHFYHLIPDELMPIVLDSVLLGAVVLCGVIFSLKYNSRIIAFEAFLLGYVIPFTGAIDTHTLVYTLILTTGAVILSRREGWLLLGIGGVNAMYIINMFFYVTPDNYITGATFLVLYFGVLALMIMRSKSFMIQAGIGLMGIFWTYINHFMFYINDFTFSRGVETFAMTSAFLAIYFILFTALSFTFRRANNNEISNDTLLLTDAIYVSLNTLFFYGIFLWRLNEVYPSYCGLFTLVMAGVYLLLGYIAAGRKIKSFIAINLILCLIFMTLTAPIQVDDEYVTIVWIIEMLILFGLGIYVNNKILRIFSNIIGGIVITKIIFIDSWQLEGLTRFFIFLFGIFAFYVSAVLYHKKTEMLEKYERYLEVPYVIGGTIITTIMLAVELISELEASGGWLSAAWSLQAILLLLIGFYYKYKPLRILGLILFFITIFKVFFYDLADLETFYRIISFMVLGVILLSASFAYSKYKDRI